MVIFKAWQEVLKDYKECEICARDTEESEMMTLHFKNPKKQEWLKQQRTLFVPPNKDTVTICGECLDELNPEYKRKNEAGDFE